MTRRMILRRRDEWVEARKQEEVRKAWACKCMTLCNNIHVQLMTLEGGLRQGEQSENGCRQKRLRWKAYNEVRAVAVGA